MSAAPARVVGTAPWLPWPLSAWGWWTRPVRAERLASLRVAIGLFLLLDLLLTYGPHLTDFFGPDSLGSPDLFAWRAASPRLSWSLLRGPADPQLSLVALAAWAGCTVYILSRLSADVFARRPGPGAGVGPGLSLGCWTAAGAVTVAGVWARAVESPGPAELAWLVPLAGVAASGLFLALAEWRRLARPELPDSAARTWPWWTVTGLWLALVGAGIGIAVRGDGDPAAWWVRVLRPWQEDPALLRVALGAWVVSAVLLLVGLGARAAALAAWALSISFGNLNSSIDNAGDTVRIIALFYLMLSPCGAVWSVDALLRRGRADEVLYVPPWPLRLLFVQMTFIYFCNGLFKLMGPSWWYGESLYYALGDLTLTRMSLATSPVPVWAMRGLTWLVLVWEVSFPLLVLWRWSRLVALVVGVGFHLGIFASMELGGFVPYMLCLYAPLLPWERWVGR